MADERDNGSASEWLRLRVKPSELAAVRLAAESAGVSVTEYVLRALAVAMSKKPTERFTKLKRACWHNPWLAERYNLPYRGPRKR